MNICFIVNPVAGKGRALSAVDKAAKVVREAGVRYEVRRTREAGDAVGLAAQAAAEGFDQIVAVGGDGTVCEVAQGLVGLPCAMGIIPGGTGNDYRRSLLLPAAPAEAAKVLLEGAPRTVDAMQADEFVSINISTVGFDSEVVKNAERFSALRGMSYFASVLYTVLRYKSPELRVTLADGTTFDGSRFLVAAGNGTHYGGGIQILPGADSADGLLDLCVVDCVRMPGDLFTLLPKVMKGKHRDGERVHLLRTESLTIESETPLTLNVDGNLFEGRKKVSMKILPRALRIVAPAPKKGEGRR